MLLVVENLHASYDRIKALHGISFKIDEGEIVTIIGANGAGKSTTLRAISRLIESHPGSKIQFMGKNLLNYTPDKVVSELGISHVPEERIKFGIAPGLFIYDNAVLKQHHLKRFSNKLFLKYVHIKEHSKNLVDDFQVLTPSINIMTKNLSGGNIQKLILGREISEQPPLLVASHPTYGLDVGATEYLRKQLLKRRKEGGAVLLVSEDLEEIFELCDRIAILFQGEFMGILDSDDPRISNIGLMMAGSLRV